MLIFTAGKKVECTIAVREAKKYKEKGVVIDALLFAADYELNPDNYAALKDVVSFPPEQHFHVTGGLHNMASEGARDSLVS